MPKPKAEHRRRSKNRREARALQQQEKRQEEQLQEKRMSLYRNRTTIGQRLSYWFVGLFNPGYAEQLQEGDIQQLELTQAFEQQEEAQMEEERRLNPVVTIPKSTFANVTEPMITLIGAALPRQRFPASPPQATVGEGDRVGSIGDQAAAIPAYNSSALTSPQPSWGENVWAMASQLSGALDSFAQAIPVWPPVVGATVVADDRQQDQEAGGQVLQQATEEKDADKERELIQYKYDKAKKIITYSRRDRFDGAAEVLRASRKDVLKKLGGHHPVQKKNGDKQEEVVVPKEGEEGFKEAVGLLKEVQAYHIRENDIAALKEVNGKLEYVCYQLAIKHYAAKAYEEAISNISQAIALYQERIKDKNEEEDKQYLAKWYGELSQIYYASGNYTEAVEALSHSTQLAFENPSSSIFPRRSYQIYAVEVHYMAGNLEQAGAIFKEMANKLDVQDVLRAIGFDGLRNKALKQEIPITELVPPYSGHYLDWLENILTGMNKQTKAIEVSYVVTSLRPASPSMARHYYAYGTHHTTPDHEAIQALQRIISLVPDADAARYHAAIGERYKRGKDYDQAIASFQQALRLDYNNAEYHAGLGDVYIKDGNLNAAKDAYVLAIAFAPQRHAYHVQLSDIAIQLGREDLASTYLDIAERLNPMEREMDRDMNRNRERAACLQLGNIYYQQKEYEKAVPLYERVFRDRLLPLALSGPDARYLAAFQLGHSYYQLGDYPRASSVFENYLSDKNQNTFVSNRWVIADAHYQAVRLGKAGKGAQEIYQITYKNILNGQQSLSSAEKGFIYYRLYEGYLKAALVGCLVLSAGFLGLSYRDAYRYDKRIRPYKTPLGYTEGMVKVREIVFGNWAATLVEEKDLRSLPKSIGKDSFLTHLRSWIKERKENDERKENKAMASDEWLQKRLVLTDGNNAIMETFSQASIFIYQAVGQDSFNHWIANFTPAELRESTRRERPWLHRKLFSGLPSVAVLPSEEEMRFAGVDRYFDKLQQEDKMEEKGSEDESSRAARELRRRERQEGAVIEMV